MSDRHEKTKRRGGLSRHPSPVTHHSSLAPNRIDQTFARLRGEGKKALIAYIMGGDPSLQETEALVLELERAGADIIELGVPFSDPIADGPVIQRAAERALRSGTTLKKILDVVAALRGRTQVPLVLMTYYNVIHAMGEADFCRRACSAGVDGVIVPDMPPEEGAQLADAAERMGLHVIHLLAPTSTASRRASIASRSRGFIYYVSLTGITGAALTDTEDVRRNVEKIAKVSDTPVAVGFGIATPEDAANVARLADGVIVGSAIVRLIGEGQQRPGLAERVGRFVRDLKQAVASVAA
jgi:tryptophan synthase alpha chain